MSAARSFDAAIIGAGPAGSAAAAILARGGRRIVVLEKDRFPRPKVCGAFLSGSAAGSLERLGALESVTAIAERIEAGSIFLPGCRAVPFRLPSPGFGISRFALDDLLAGNAGRLGAELLFGARVLAIEEAPGPAFRIRFAAEGGEREIEARAVIGAWGRWDALDRRLKRGFLGGRARYLAWSRVFAAGGSPAGQVRLYAFPGGYCGLSRVENGMLNLAGVISEAARRRLPAGWPAVLAHARLANVSLDRDLAGLAEGPLGFLGTGPVFFTAKPPVEAGMLMAGDAAGVIDPFSGEGQASALSSGILAGEAVERGLAGQIAMEAVAPAYADAWRRRFGRPFSWSAAFRRLMLSPAAGALAARLGGETLVSLALNRLAVTSPSRPRV